MSESITPKTESEPVFQKLDRSSFEKIFELEQLAMNTNTTFPYSREQLEKAFDHGDIFYGLVDGGGTLYAKVGFTRKEDGRFELDIGTHPRHQGKGLGRRIMQLSIRDLISRFPNASIYLKVHPDNTRGINLYTSENFVESGRIDTPHGPRIVMDMIPIKN